MALYDSQTPFLASFVILRNDGKIAFVLRQNTRWMNGHYGPPSGKVENNESFTQAAVREAKEVGVTIKEADLSHVHTMHRKAADSDWVDTYFEVAKWEGEVVNAEAEMHGEVAWFSLDDLPENVVPPFRTALEAIERGEKYSEYGWN